MPISYGYRPEMCVLKPNYTYGPATHGKFTMPQGGNLTYNTEVGYTILKGVTNAGYTYS